MPLSGSAAWNTATADRAKHVIHIIRFDGYAAAQFSSGPVTSPSRTTKQYLSQLSGISQRVDPVTGATSVGAISFVLTDRNAEVTDLLATLKSSPTLATLLNRKVTILAGYAGLAEADYATIPGGSVLDVEQTRDLAGYEFSLGDPKRPSITDIFTNADPGSDRVDTTLTATAAGAIWLGLASVAGITQGDKLMLGPNGSGQEEVVTVRAVYVDSVVLKAVTVYAYSAGNQVRWATTIVRGNPINILYSVLTGSFLTTGSFPLTYVQGLPTGLGISTADIDTAGLASERDHWLSGMTMSFEISTRQRGLDFINKELGRLFGYPVVTADGKFGFKVYGPRVPSVTPLTITASDVADGAWSYTRRLDVAYNRLVVKTEYSVDFDRFDEERVYEDTTNQATVGVREIVIEYRGLTETEANIAYLGDFARRFLQRFMPGAAQLTMHLHMSKRGATLGEQAQVTHSLIPNLRTGARGITAGAGQPEFEVVEVHQLLEDGLVKVVLQDNGFTRPWFIAPAGQPDYGSASAAQKAYAYISPAAGANFSDGTEPYKVI